MFIWIIYVGSRTLNFLAQSLHIVLYASILAFHAIQLLNNGS